MESFPGDLNPGAVPAAGLLVTLPAGGAIERLAPEWEWIFIDGQHGDLDLGDVSDLIRAADAAGRPALVRVPGHEDTWLRKALDFGAAGVIVPMVESAAEARALVRAAKLRPLGNRSRGSVRLARTAVGPPAPDREPLLILQLESESAVALADEIASIEGVDGLFVGPGDLVIRKGQELDAAQSVEEVGPPCDRVAGICRGRGKLSVGMGIGDGARQIARRSRYGLVAGGSDAGFLAAGSAEAGRRIGRRRGE